MVELGRPEIAFEFGDNLAGSVIVLERRDRHAKITRVGEAIGADRSQFGQPEQCAIVLADIAARPIVEQLHVEFDAARHDGDFARPRLDYP